MKLMIIESPGKIEKLTSILGSGWKVVASVGHIRDLPEKEMAVEPPDFKPKYVLTERGAEVVKRLKALADSADQVFLATDPDREGESISWHLQQALKLNSPYRVTFNEITPNAVKLALLKPRGIDGKLVAAQEARRVLDRLVGYKVSPVLSRNKGEKLSAGRVQSIAVRLVVDREREIKAFKPTDHFGVQLDFGDWNAQWLVQPDFVEEDFPYFQDEAFARKVAGIQQVTVVDAKKKNSERNPPPPFTTSTMQQAASVKLNLNPEKAMATAQSLYEQGHITYHRTDNPNVSDDALGDIYAVAVKQGLKMAAKPRKFKTPDGAQVGHPAITPTHWEVETAGKTEEEQALYRLIRLRAIACQLAPAVYAVSTLMLHGIEAGSGREVRFEARGQKLVEAGWLSLLGGDDTEEETEKEAVNPVPLLESGTSLTPTAGKVVAKRTKAPARYTEASLVRKMEAEGIGRPATYAAIMGNITRRGYVVAEKRFLRPTDLAEKVRDGLVGNFSFAEIAYTREMEKVLDDIASGHASYHATVSSVHSELEQELKQFNQNVLPAHPCPKCGKALVHRFKPGKKGYDFWGCSGFAQGCKVSFKNNNGMPDLTQ